MDESNDELLAVLKALASETRLRIVRLLAHRTLCVNAISRHMDITQGALSQNLSILKSVGLVVTERHGNFIHYRLDTEKFENVSLLLSEHLDGNEDKHV